MKTETPICDASINEMYESEGIAAVSTYTAKKLEKENRLLKSLVLLQAGYQNLLADELNEVVGIASVHGWRSTRYEKGCLFRKRVKEILERKET